MPVLNCAVGTTAEFVNVVPPAQFLSRYTFFTDPTYPETNLVLIRRPDAKNNYQDVNIEFSNVSYKSRFPFQLTAKTRSDPLHVENP